MNKPFLYTLLLIIGLASPLSGQFFQATITSVGNDLIFSIRPFPGGGDISTDWSDIEFFVRHPTSAPAFQFGTITVNTAQFPGISIPYNGVDMQGAETGFTNHWFGTSFASTTSRIYLDGQTYEVFRVALNVTPTNLNLELVHNEPAFSPHYLALTAGTGGADRTSNPITHNKFFGASANICSPVNCPASTAGANHRMTLSGSAPLEMLSFDAQKFDTNSSALHWETANEREVRQFDIERSFEGLDWLKIGQSMAKNQINNHYEWIDKDVVNKNPGIRQAYYRLLVTDLDGSREYSDIRTVEFDATKKFSVFPNPFTENLSLQTDYHGLMNIRLYDLGGRLLLARQIEADSRNQIITGDILKQLPAAPMFISISDENQILLHRELLIHL